MKVKIIYIILFMAWVLQAPAQSKFNYSWVSGIFNTYTMKYDGNDFVFVDSIYSLNWIQFIGGANICDSNGDVKLMSSGYTIFDKNKSIIDGGDSVGGRKVIQHYNGFTGFDQTGFFLPFNNNLYYYVYSTASDIEYTNWFVSGHDAVFDEMGYCKIDMKLNGGSGKVTDRELKLLTNETLSKTQMMACKHANGVDWWVFKQARGANKVFKFLFTQDSVINFGTQSFPEPVFSIYDQSGQMQFSKDGTKFASTCRDTRKIFVADFNRCTGMLSNPKLWNVPENSFHNPVDTSQKDFYTQGLSFSPNGKLLYVGMYYNVLQLDLQEPDSSLAWYHVVGIDTIWMYQQINSSLALGPDDRIYLGNWGNQSTRMRRINNPNIKGIGCDYCSHCLVMPGPGIVAPPCMPNYDLGMDSSLCWPAGTNEIRDWSREMEVYPNPTHAVIYLKNVSKKEKKVLNSVGQLLLTTTKDEIDVSCLNKGVYFLYCDGRAKRVIVD